MKAVEASKLSRADLTKLSLLLIILVVALSIFNALYIVPLRGNRFDFYPRWQGGRMLWAGQSPYTTEATEAIQQGMFGGKLPPDVDQQRMVYPAYVGIILAPLLALPSATAIAIWLTIQLLAVLLTPILWLQIIDWQPPPWLLGLLIVGLVLIFRYPVNLYLVGQFTGTILLGFSLSIYLLMHKHDILAGVVLALTAVPPTIAIPLALLLLFGYALHRRWRALLAFGTVLAILTGITILQIGWWLPDFIAQLGGYSSYAAPVWPPNLIDSTVLRVLFVLAVSALLLLTFYRFWKTQHAENFAVAAILVCLLLLPQTGNYYLILLIPPLLLIFRRGALLQRIGVVVAILSPWVFRSLPDPSLEALILPLYVLILWFSLQLPDSLRKSL